MSDDRSFVKGLAALHEMVCGPSGPEPEPDERDDEIARLTAEVKEATEARDHYRSETERLMKCFGTIDRQGADIALLTAEVERLQAVVEPARYVLKSMYGNGGINYGAVATMEAALRALDGEPCPRCGGEGKWYREPGRKGDSEPCPTCRGRGCWYEVGSGGPIEECQTCEGSGLISNNRPLPTAPLMPCPKCYGTGWMERPSPESIGFPCDCGTGRKQ